MTNPKSQLEPQPKWISGTCFPPTAKLHDSFILVFKNTIKHKKALYFFIFFNHFPMLASETYSTHMQLHHSLLPLPPGSGKGSSGFCSAPARFLKSRLEASWSSGALYFWKFSAEQIAWRQAQPRWQSKDAKTWRWAPRPGAALTPQGFLWGTGKHHSLQHGPRTAPPVQGEMLLSHSRVHGGTLSGTYIRACKEPA